MTTPEIEVDTADPTPPYEQIRRQITVLISSGALLPEESLPSVRHLANDLGLAPGTISRSYKELETRGWVQSRRGSGTRVHTNPPLRNTPSRKLDELAGKFTEGARRLGYTDADILDAVKDVILQR